MDFKARFEGRTTKITKDGDLNGTVTDGDGDKSAKYSSSVIHSHVSHHRMNQATPQHLFQSISSAKDQGVLD